MPIMRNLTHTIQGKKVYFPAANFFDLAQFGASAKEGENIYPALLCLAVPCSLDSQKLYTYLGTKYLLVVAEIVEIKALTLYLTCCS